MFPAVAVGPSLDGTVSLETVSARGAEEEVHKAYELRVVDPVATAETPDADDPHLLMAYPIRVFAPVMDHPVA